MSVDMILDSAMLVKWFQPTRLETRTEEASMCASTRVTNPQCVMKVKVVLVAAEVGYESCTTDRPPSGWFESEHTCRDPKDGELCVGRTKPGETLVEVRSDRKGRVGGLISQM